MSGESSGYVFLGATALLPFIAAGFAVYGAVKLTQAVVSASRNYEQNNRRKRQLEKSRNNINSNQNSANYNSRLVNNQKNNSSDNIKRQIQQSGISESIGSLRRDIQDNMQEQTRLNVQASDKMISELESQRRDMFAVAEKGDVEGWRSYMNSLSANHTGTIQKIYGIQQDFSNNYQKSITKSMYEISAKVNEQYNNYLGELRKLSADNAVKQKLAEEIASAYIEEAKSLISTLENDFEGNRFSPRETAALRAQMNKVISLYNSGNYEAAIAGAKDNSVGIMEELYNTDLKRQEWENYQKLVFVLSEELKVYLENHEYITEEVKAYAEEKLGEKLPDEIVGIRLADYTAKNKQGKTKYDFIHAKVIEIYNAVRSQNGNQLSTAQLKEYADYLNNKLYAEAAETISMGILNMNNAFSRQSMSEEIIDFFEEHNFTFNGYAFENDRHDGALHIGLKNEAAGEEILVTLAPELVNGEIQTKVDIKQTAGDEANEERKKYYRESVVSVVKGGNPTAEVQLKCCEETFGKLSSDTETKAKIQKNQSAQNS